MNSEVRRESAETRNVVFGQVLVLPSDSVAFLAGRTADSDVRVGHSDLTVWLSLIIVPVHRYRCTASVGVFYVKGLCPGAAHCVHKWLLATAVIWRDLSCNFCTAANGGKDRIILLYEDTEFCVEEETADIQGVTGGTDQTSGGCSLC